MKNSVLLLVAGLILSAALWAVLAYFGMMILYACCAIVMAITVIDNFRLRLILRKCKCEATLDANGVRRNWLR